MRIALSVVWNDSSCAPSPPPENVFALPPQALANSGLAKKVANSAEAYHHIMLKYATSKPSFEADAR